MGPGVEPFYAQILRGGPSRRDDLGTEFFLPARIGQRRPDWRPQVCLWDHELGSLSGR